MNPWLILLDDVIYQSAKLVRAQTANAREPRLEHEVLIKDATRRLQIHLPSLSPKDARKMATLFFEQNACVVRAILGLALPRLIAQKVAKKGIPKGVKRSSSKVSQEGVHLPLNIIVPLLLGDDKLTTHQILKKLKEKGFWYANLAGRETSSLRDALKNCNSLTWERQLVGKRKRRLFFFCLPELTSIEKRKRWVAFRASQPVTIKTLVTEYEKLTGETLHRRSFHRDLVSLRAKPVEDGKWQVP